MTTITHPPQMLPAAVPAVSDAREPRRPRSGFRPDLQGVRALAVLLVIFNHLWGRPWGGFLGVDVFFVLSGFLITGLLLREQRETGRISLRAFYWRRVKRLSPAALFTITTTILISALLFSPQRFSKTLTDGLFSIATAANWHFAIEGTDYMQQSDSPSPFLHFWSLAVEEQFYMAWPLLLGLVFLARRFVPLPAARVVAIGLVGVGSLAWAVWESSAHPTIAYFSTLSRAWELAIGAGLAVLLPRLRSVPVALGRVLSWGGLVGLLVTVVALPSSTAVPAPGALPAVLCACAIIAGGAIAPAPFVLRSRSLVYVGTISYSLYLWHYPVIVFTGQLFPQHGKKYALAALVVTVMLAVLSYHAVENPLRRARWRPGIVRPTTARGSRRSPLRLAALAIALVGVMVACYSLRQSDNAQAFPAGAITSFSALSSQAKVRAAAIESASKASVWTPLSPDYVTARDDRAPEWIRSGCLGNDVHALADPVKNAERCVFGDPHGQHRMLVTGDSTAISYVPGLLAAFPSSWRLEIWTLGECSAADAATLHHDDSPYPQCDDFRRKTVQHIRQTHPDVVVASNSEFDSSQMASGNGGAAVIPRWTTATERMLEHIAPEAGKVVLLDAPPVVTDIADCRTPVSTPQDCNTGINAHYVWTVTAQRAAVQALQLPNVSYPETLPWFCTRDGICPPFAGQTLIRADTIHLTTRASRELAPLLKAAIDG